MATEPVTNLHSHSRADLSRNHKVIDELTDLVERVTTEVSTERAAFTTNLSALASTSTQSEVSSPTATQRQLSPEHPNDREAREWRKAHPFGADLADNACRNLEE